jgi:preprotein translocase subunit SecD
VQITGRFITIEQANDMAILLRSGELPGRLTVIEQRSP